MKNSGNASICSCVTSGFYFGTGNICKDSQQLFFESVFLVLFEELHFITTDISVFPAMNLKLYFGGFYRSFE